jgi:hypothetical protein
MGHECHVIGIHFIIQSLIGDDKHPNIGAVALKVVV